MMARLIGRLGWSGLVAMVLIPGPAAWAQGPARAGIGAMGDSYTDEYRFYPPNRSAARNWVEILSATRRLNFGPSSLRDRGVPRHRGFAYNWAREGATSDDLIDQGQHIGLADQVRRGQVQVAVLFIGGNDFLLKVLAAPDPEAALATVVPEAVTNVTTALDTVLAASPDVRVVLVTVPSVELLPIVRVLAFDPQSAALVAAVGGAVEQYNDQLRALAGVDSRVAIADFAAQTMRLATNPNPLTVGGVTIDATIPGNGFRQAFVADGIHIGTVVQGLLANLIVATMNESFGTRIRPLSEREIIRFARTARAPQGTGP